MSAAAEQLRRLAEEIRAHEPVGHPFGMNMLDGLCVNCGREPDGHPGYANERAFGTFRNALPAFIEVVEVLQRLEDPVCNAFCPTTWRTGEQQPHGEECRSLRNALQQLTSAISEPTTNSKRRG